ncbi:Amylo-alpha-1,6-glucosidase [Poriferisphaera corsica]|uniref:Amylo-alpha-1,6-glucosidase n=1 Tax=Poriferisphaera corsica TaxID=2528020 RepID=A0A517YZ98_9BACT|nr:amylo-alpha-1,6-glucosidase [Poriferisphaera corsica]QDU35560.1 Amylo-alpha-1,6-glucosidase [Poriferisphaera corsica]
MISWAVLDVVHLGDGAGVEATDWRQKASHKMSETMIEAEQAWVTHKFDEAGGVREMVEEEWLLSNGTGAFCSGTVIGSNTRRYHGLLCACKHPPVGRELLVGQMVERLDLLKENEAMQSLEFSTCEFRDEQGEATVYAPQGLHMLKSFERGLDVGWVYEWNNVGFERRINLHWKKQAATLTYRMWGFDAEEFKGGVLQLAPMMLIRDFHELLRHDDPEQPRVAGDGKVLRVWRGDTAATLSASEGWFGEAQDWWYNVYYRVERDRGLGDQEDYFIPGMFTVELDQARMQKAVDRESAYEVTVTIALGEQAAEPERENVERLVHLEKIANKLAHDGKKGESIVGDKALIRQLANNFAIASDDFVVDRWVGDERLSTILAGFPWFADWGRDTFIALPGLMLTTGRYEEAKGALRTFARFIQNGLVPNLFDDYDDKAAHYNTVDGSLWFVHAAVQYVKLSGDKASWREWLAEACVKIIEAYRVGTDYHIHMEEDGLIHAGDPESQLTWMDAKRDGIAFTPRYGKPVEINALWYNALMSLKEALRDAKMPEHATEYGKLAGLVKKSFIDLFWREDLGCLFDCVHVGDNGHVHKDSAIRPNMVFAISLPHSPLPQAKAKRVLEMAREKLLTPVGMRTLSEDNPQFERYYTGDQFNRDKAYHQGTIWPWPIGAFAEGVLRVGKFSKKSRKEAFAVIEPLCERVLGRGVGQLHEIFEAQPIEDAKAAYSHRAVGCWAQAWSISEVLRVLMMIERGK